jgi:LuxR family transcriptional regulator, maltose regulon positive regulatory protein
MPALRTQSIARAGLVNRLRAAHSARLVIVSAPAGYGKTTLVAEWARRDDRPFAWYSVDPSDGPDAFVAHLHAAVVRALPEQEGYEPEARMDRPDEGIAHLGALLASSRFPMVVVVDDVDLVRDSESARFLARLVDELPSSSQLVLLSRARPPLPLARLRARGGVVELDGDDLRFGDRDAAALLSGLGIDLPPDDVSALNVAVEGWPAGLHLAALGFRSCCSNGEPATHAGDGLMLDYFRTELLSRLSPDDVRFLTRASVLERLCGSLCDVVTETSDGAERLERLQRSNLFVVPLDREGHWYRLHTVFGNVLAAELERREPGVAATLRRRAARWCAEHGTDELALRYARGGGDLEQLVELLERSTPFSLTARPADVEDWLDSLDGTALLRDHPAAAAIGALTLAATGRPDAADRWADVAAQEPGAEAGAPWQALLRSFTDPSGADEMRTHAEDALDALPLGSAWRAPALLALACARALEGDTLRAGALLGEAADTAASAGAGAVESAALAYESLLSAERGDCHRADALAEAARRVVGRSHVEDSVTTLFTLAASSRSALRKGDWATVRADLERVPDLLPRLTHAIGSFSVLLRLEFARVQLALGDASGASRLLDEVDEIFARRPRLGVFREESDALRVQTEADLRRSRGRAATLTAAELRLLPLLTTHLSFREIATRLYVSRNTVKTQAISVYRKLGVSSRRDAIARASELGLVAGSDAERW